MKRPTTSLLPALLLSLTAAPASAENPDEKLLTPYPGTNLDLNELKDYDELVIPLGPTKGGKLTKSETVQGRWTRLQYSAPAGRSPLEVYKNYEAALKKGGFLILFACRQGDKEECGDGQIPVKGLVLWPYQTSHYIAARLDQKGTRIWAEVDVRSNAIFVNVLREKAMEMDKVSVDAAALKKGIADDGHVAVYGIEFDTGKADLKAASAPIVDEIAKLLKQDPKLKIYVVGHTDNVGGLDSNLDLSRRRAASVVKDLTARHKVEAARLSAQGVGPLVPLASNGAEAGRARNRRVDLVQQ